MWLKILPTTCQHAFFWGCLGGGALFTTADFHLLFLPFPNELVHWASLPAKEPKSSKRKRWGKSMSITHHKQRNNNDVWENNALISWMKVPCELFTYFSTTFHPNRFMFSFRSVTRHDHQSRSCHRWDWSWKPRSKPVLVLLVGRWHQTNKQESKWNSHMVHYGILWPLCLKSPCMNCTVRVMVWRFLCTSRATATPLTVFVGQCICLCALSKVIFTYWNVIGSWRRSISLQACLMTISDFSETSACLAFRSFSGIGLCRQSLEQILVKHMQKPKRCLSESIMDTLLVSHHGNALTSRDSFHLVRNEVMRLKQSHDGIHILHGYKVSIHVKPTMVIQQGISNQVRLGRRCWHPGLHCAGHLETKCTQHHWLACEDSNVALGLFDAFHRIKQATTHAKTPWLKNLLLKFLSLRWNKSIRFHGPSWSTHLACQGSTTSHSLGVECHTLPLGIVFQSKKVQGSGHWSTRALDKGHVYVASMTQYSAAWRQEVLITKSLWTELTDECHSESTSTVPWAQEFSDSPACGYSQRVKMRQDFLPDTTVSAEGGPARQT